MTTLFALCAATIGYAWLAQASQPFPPHCNTAAEPRSATDGRYRAEIGRPHGLRPVRRRLGRPQLSRRDRSLVTVSALIAMTCPDQLRSHLALARQNGLTEEELVEAITHLAFYSGWPNAVAAVGMACDVFKKN